MPRGGFGERAGEERQLEGGVEIAKRAGSYAGPASFLPSDAAPASAVVAASCAPITHGPVLWEGAAFFFAAAGPFFGGISSLVVIYFAARYC